LKASVFPAVLRRLEEATDNAIKRVLIWQLKVQIFAKSL
jgi:hypothetical protein